MDPTSALFVGGLDQEVTPALLKAAFEPFGPVVDAEIPADMGSTQKHRGFGFVTFEEAEDAAEAVDNMEGAELFGRTLSVNVAKKRATRLGSKQAVWADKDAWFGAGGGDEQIKAEQAAMLQQADAEAKRVVADAKRKFAEMSPDEVANLLAGKKPKRDASDPYDVLRAQQGGKAHTGINFGSYGGAAMQPYNHYGSSSGGGARNRAAIRK